MYDTYICVLFLWRTLIYKQLSAELCLIKFIHQSSKPHCDGIWRWKLHEVIRVRLPQESGAFMIGLEFI